MNKNMDLANKAAFISQDWQSNKYLHVKVCSNRCKAANAIDHIHNYDICGINISIYLSKWYSATNLLYNICILDVML